jgi:hypothetical protein
MGKLNGGNKMNEQEKVEQEKFQKDFNEYFFKTMRKIALPTAIICLLLFGWIFYLLISMFCFWLNH